MIDDDVEDIVQADIKQRSKRGMKAQANVRDQVAVQPSAMQNLINCSMYWDKYPQANTDDEIDIRADEFFLHIADTGEYPLWEAFCLALGHDRKTVWRWAQGIGCTDRRSHIIKRAKEKIAFVDANLASMGIMPQIVYIFRAKNYYDMVDKQEYTIEPKNTLGNVVDADEIEKRLIDGV